MHFFQDSIEDYTFLDLTSVLMVQDSFTKSFCREEEPARLKICLRVISMFVGNGQEEVQIDTVS